MSGFDFLGFFIIIYLSFAYIKILFLFPTENIKMIDEAIVFHVTIHSMYVFIHCVLSIYTS